jgi:cytochrome c peroxidase
MCLLLAGSLAEGTSFSDSAPKPSSYLLEEVPAPHDNQLTPERIELGKMLFFDPRLSGGGRISCATCHNPSLGWSDGLRVARGEDMHALKRATPSLVNVGFNQFQMWDGRFHSLEDQVWTPMLASAEMHGLQDEILTKLAASPGYVAAFAKAYAGEGITRESVSKAIASFERSIVSRDAPFDRWMAGDDSAVSDSAKRGFAIFNGKGNCNACHQGGNFTDQGFHNIGLRDDGDPGRYAITPIRISRGAFKTPTLRDVAASGPYMHNGAYRTLAEVIDHYDRGGDDRENLDPNIKPLALTAQEKKDLLEFLRTLTAPSRPFVVPQLPQAQP